MIIRPRIGINMSATPDESGNMSLTLPLAYIDAVSLAGGVPVCLPPCSEFSDLQEVLPLLDGMLFVGGLDYRPEHYGGHSQPDCELIWERRDNFDWQLAGFIIRKTKIPVLGICGGMQLLSIVESGKLIQDIKTEWINPEGKMTLPHAANERKTAEKQAYRHKINITPQSMLAKIAENNGEKTILTNSAHHQAVRPDCPGRDWRVTACTSDGIVEAIEPAIDSALARDGRFLLGVQWHPERLLKEKFHLHVFCALINAARKNLKGLHEK